MGKAALRAGTHPAARTPRTRRIAEGCRARGPRGAGTVVMGVHHAQLPPQDLLPQLRRRHDPAGVRLPEEAARAPRL